MAVSLVVVTHDTGEYRVVGVHCLEWLFDTDTVLNEDDGGVLANDRRKLLGD